MSVLQKGHGQINPAHVRRHILKMAFRGNTPHIACSFSIVEILVSLYNDCLSFNRADPTDPNRDFLILSKGHGVMAQYGCYRELGWLTEEHLDQYGTDGSGLHGICEYKVPGFEVSSGSLGHGLPVAVGMALGLKRSNRSHQKVYCIVGDGEMNEGPIWESLLFASHQQLNNLIVIVDANGLQAMGKNSEVLNLEPFLAKFEAFGFESLECDGHNQETLKKCIFKLTENSNSTLPKAVIARTVKGKGVSFMESNNLWHYARLSEETLARAMLEIEKS